MDTTIVYSSKAEKYAKYRWDYASQAVQTILDITQISSESTIADIGAGTGILTRHFVDKVNRVFAIERNLEMRQLAIRDLDRYLTFHMIEGSAEATTLPEQSVDLITVAQAIHWFEPEATKTEFLRILKPNGWLAVLRNFGTNDELREAIGEILIEENGVDTSYASKLPAEKPMSFYYGHDDFLKMSFPFTLQENWDHFIGAICSAANMPLRRFLIDSVQMNCWKYVERQNYFWGISVGHRYSQSKEPPNKSMHANCYAAFNRNWLGLRRRVSIASGFAGSQSRDFKR